MGYKHVRMIECCVFIWISAHAGECAAEGALFRPRRVPGSSAGLPLAAAADARGRERGRRAGTAPPERWLRAAQSLESSPEGR